MTHAVDSTLCLSACVILDDAQETRVCVKALLHRLSGIWTLELSRCSYKSGGDRRLGLAVKRLCELDAALELTLREGRAVRRNVPCRPDLSDGPHSAVEQIIPLLLPRKVDDSLYSYQRHGVAWLLRHDRALLGDDMGLGKTAQALSAARRLIRSGAIAWALVVAPRTLIANWIAEARRWAPELTVATALPLGASREDRWRRLVRRAHLVMTSYEQLREPTEALAHNPPDLVIADEAHRLRRTESQSTQGFRTLKIGRLWALTGTPIERDAEDLAVLMSLLDPARFSPDDRSLHPTSLRARLRPYLLRRKKEDVLDELPPIIEDHEVLELTTEQRAAYRAAIAEHAKSGSNAGFLPLFNRLRTLCDVEPNAGASSKLDRIVELLIDIAKSGEKAVIFSYILDPLRWLAQRLERNDVGVPFAVITGEMTLEERANIIRYFKSDAQCVALLASTRVASEGLTLTEANHVIFVNRWWNPSANFQARDRVVRIGQSRRVHVKSFTCRRTVEERLDILLTEKSLTFDEIIESISKSIDAQDKDFFVLP